jgi:hypothetical protein
MSGSSKTRPRFENSDQAGLRHRPSPARQRLQELTKEHERLLREVRKKQQQIRDGRTLSERLQSRLALEVAPQQESVRGLATEVERLFQRVLAPQSDVGRRDKARVRDVYAAFRDVFGGAGQLAANTQTPHQKGNRRKVPLDSNVSGVGVTAPKPDGQRAATLHAVFRRLVHALHPDKAQMPQERETRTALLKEITCAYEALDLARLTELESAHLAPAPVIDDDAHVLRRTKELDKANAELGRQVKAVALELRTLKRSLPFADEGRENDALDEVVAALLTPLGQQQQLLRDTRDVLLKVAAGDVTTLAFLLASWNPLPEARSGVQRTRKR